MFGFYESGVHHFAKVKKQIHEKPGIIDENYLREVIDRFIN
ncbi:hypothetical protein [Pseudothermotoga elfii]